MNCNILLELVDLAYYISLGDVPCCDAVQPPTASFPQLFPDHHQGGEWLIALLSGYSPAGRLLAGAKELALEAAGGPLGLIWLHKAVVRCEGPPLGRM